MTFQPGSLADIYAKTSRAPSEGGYREWVWRLARRWAELFDALGDRESAAAVRNGGNLPSTTATLPDGTHLDFMGWVYAKTWTNSNGGVLYEVFRKPPGNRPAYKVGEWWGITAGDAVDAHNFAADTRPSNTETFFALAKGRDQ